MEKIYTVNIIYELEISVSLNLKQYHFVFMPINIVFSVYYVLSSKLLTHSLFRGERIHIVNFDNN